MSLKLTRRISALLKKSINGLPGYRGFEYQIEATVWVALHLMLREKRCDIIVVEPQSAEDLELAVNADQSSSSVEFTVSPARRLVLQFKTRSTGPWTKSALSGVVGNGLPSERKVSGPPPRERALEMLIQRHDTTYVLVTDAGVDSNISLLVATSLLGSSTTSIPTGILDNKLKSCAPALNGRLAILPSVTRELIFFRINDLISRIGKVPHVCLNACVDSLKSQVRKRLLGELAGEFDLADLESTLKKHGGVFDSPPMDGYFPPDDMAKFEAFLSEQNVLVLLGKPGMGKSLLASYLSYLHRRYDPPFMIHHERNSPGVIERLMQEPGPALFVISDPWGVSNNKGPSEMTHDLSRIVGSANADKRFIITSRDDVYDDVDVITRRKLDRFEITLSTDSYAELSLWNIVTRHLSSQSSALEVAQGFRSQILSELKSPAELDLFGALLSKTNKETLDAWAEALRDLIFEDQPWTAPHSADTNVMDLIKHAGSLVSGQYAQEILSDWMSSHTAYVAASWVLFESFEHLDELEFIELLDSVKTLAKERPPQDFIKLLKKTKIVEERDGHLIIHSLSLGGIRDLLNSSRHDALLAIEKIVMHYVSLMSEAEGINHLGYALRILETWSKWNVGPVVGFQDAIALIDNFLERKCLESVGEELQHAVFMAAWWPLANNKLVQFAGSWRAREPSSDWYPPDFSTSVTHDIFTSGHVAKFLPLFVSEVMPNTSVHYGRNIQAFVAHICCFGIDLGPAARSALDLIYYRLTVDDGSNAHLDPDVDLNLKPLKAVFTNCTGEHYPELPGPTPDWEL
ncbi:hypothetical protein ALQ61_04291 [Pseudomonas coronafaciens pv. zizaniae]|nr:hypothetical protein ALQ61_04291 [Pseudomonas coronafaciens pv. zizaniae]